MTLEVDAEASNSSASGVRPATSAPATSPSATVAALEPSPRSRGIRSVNANEQALGRGQPRERADREVVGSGGCVAALGHLELVPELERRGRAVEARPEVRGRRRRPDSKLHAEAISSSKLPVPSARGRSGRRRPGSPWSAGAREPGDGRGGRRLAEDPLLPRERPPRRHDLCILDGHLAARCRDRLSTSSRVHRVADPDRGRNRGRPRGRLDRDEARHGPGPPP